MFESNRPRASRMSVKDVGPTLVTYQQRVICERLGLVPDVPPPDSKVGLSETACTGAVPLNGLRHPPEGDASGWYVWGGDVLSEDADFFSPLCFRHLDKRCPAVVDFLALPPGWRFLLAPDQVDVWFDESLLRV